MDVFQRDLGDKSALIKIIGKFGEDRIFFQFSQNENIFVKIGELFANFDKIFSF